MQEGVLYAVIDDELLSRAAALLEVYRAKRMMLATAESCTGGLVTACLTEIAGSSDVVERGFVTYSNEAKTEMLGVPADLIRNHGAVSEEVAHAMADGALAHARADVAVSITGIAGPGGGPDGARQTSLGAQMCLRAAGRVSLHDSHSLLSGPIYWWVHENRSIWTQCRTGRYRTFSTV